jgi:hypothetical protein
MLPKFYLKEFLARIVFLILQIISWVVKVVIFIVCLLIQCPDAVEGILSPFIDDTNDTYFTPLCTEIPLHYTYLDDIESYPSEIEYLDESSEYDPFDAGYDPNLMDVNRYAFEKNSGLSYDILHVNGITVAVGCENSIFTVDLIEIIKDLSIEQVNEIDNKGNNITTLTINTEVARNLMEALSVDSGNSLFSGLAQAREKADAEYEQAIANIGYQSVVFSSEGSNILSPLQSGDILTFMNVNPINTESFATELENLNQTRMDWHERIQTFFSNQISDRQPMPSWSVVPTRPTNPWDIEQWERDNVIRRFWSARLNGGYDQTNVVIVDSPFDYEKENTGIFKDDSLYLDNLFGYNNL